jgi:hypothetical protein
MNTIDVQHHFKQCYNKVFKHDSGLPPFEDDHVMYIYTSTQWPSQAWDIGKLPNSFKVIAQWFLETIAIAQC